MEAVQRALEDHKVALDVATAIVALILSGAALRFRSSPRAAAWLAAAAGAALATAMSMDDFLHPWDERYHAVVARHLMRHPLVPTLYENPPLPTPQAWGSGHVWIHKPPLALWLISGSLWLFGLSELAVRLPSILLLAACAYATARIGSRLIGDGAGVLGAFLVAINGNLLDLASGRKPTDHVDGVLVSLTCLAIWSALEHAAAPSRWRAASTGLLAGLAVLTKWLIGLLPFAVWVVMLRRRRERWIDVSLGALICAAVAAPWQLYTAHAFPEQAALESAHRLQHLFQPLDGHVGTPLFYLARIPRTFGELSPLAVVWFLWKRREPALFTWAAVPYIFFAFVATRMENYVMVAAPAIALMVAWAALELWNGAGLWKRAIAAALVLLPVRYAVERWEPFHRFEEERAVAARLRTLPAGRVLLVGASHPIEAMFYGEREAYAGTPDPPVLARLRAEGWQVVENAP